MRSGTGAAVAVVVTGLLAVGCQSTGPATAQGGHREQPSASTRTDGEAKAAPVRDRDGGKPKSGGESHPEGAKQGQADREKSRSGKDRTGAKEPEPLREGSEGPGVRALQRELEHLHYDPGSVDGVFGATTRYALWAFQKVNGLEPDGVVGPKTRKALRAPEIPEPLVSDGPMNRVEIDLSRQVLYVYDDGDLALISHISSGSENSYCTEDGHCGDAVTPTGDFHTTWRVTGWRTSDLGRLYNPVYFVGGIAVHGEPYVPTYPASHGCVRIPMHTAEIFPDLVGEDEAVLVRE